MGIVGRPLPSKPHMPYIKFVLMPSPQVATNPLSTRFSNQRTNRGFLLARIVVVIAASLVVHKALWSFVYRARLQGRVDRHRVQSQHSEVVQVHRTSRTVLSPAFSVSSFFPSSSSGSNVFSATIYTSACWISVVFCCCQKPLV